MIIVRYLASPLAGIATVLLLFELLTGILPLGFVSFAGLAPVYVVALIGGIAVAAVAPRFEVYIATGTGLLAPALMYWYVLFTYRRDYWDPLSFEVMWTLGVPVAFAIGAFVFLKLRSPVPE